MSQNDPLYYEHHVFCCLNERKAGHARGSCITSGAQPLFNYFKARMKELGATGAELAKGGRVQINTRVNKAGCLDRCELGPVMVVYPEGIWYTYQSRADVDEIIDEHFVNGRIVERLRLKNDQIALTPEQAA